MVVSGSCEKRFIRGRHLVERKRPESTAGLRRDNVLDSRELTSTPVPELAESMALHTRRPFTMHHHARPATWHRAVAAAIATVALCAPPALGAQTTAQRAPAGLSVLHGFVTDGIHGQPLASATVLVEGTTAQGDDDRSGAVPNRQHSVRQASRHRAASAAGYARHSDAHAANGLRRWTDLRPRVVHSHRREARVDSVQRGVPAAWARRARWLREGSRQRCAGDWIDSATRIYGDRYRGPQVVGAT